MDNRKERLFDIIAVRIGDKEVGGILRTGMTREKVYRSANIHQSQTVNDQYYIDIVEAGSHKEGDKLDESKVISDGDEKPERGPGLLSDPLLRAVLARPRASSSPHVAVWELSKAEVLYFFAMGYAGDASYLLDIRSWGYGDGDGWDGLTPDDVGQPEGEEYYIAADWAPFQLWLWSGVDGRIDAEVLALAP